MTGTLDLTVVRPYDVAGVRRRTIGKYTGPAVYVAGGDPIDAGDLKLGEIEYFNMAGLTDGTTLYEVVYDRANKKLQIFLAAGTEVVAGTVMSTYSGYFEAVGK